LRFFGRQSAAGTSCTGDISIFDSAAEGWEVCERKGERKREK
jgi:hypothetical protein